MATMEEKEIIYPEGTCAKCGTSLPKHVSVQVVKKDDNGDVVYDANGDPATDTEKVDLLTREERICDFTQLRIISDVLVGHNEELFLPGGAPVPDGRQEMFVGVSRVQYNAQLGGGREPLWVDFDVDIGALKTENKQLTSENVRLQRELETYKRRVTALGLTGTDTE